MMLWGTLRLAGPTATLVMVISDRFGDDRDPMISFLQLLLLFL